jgi:hypothetical protein
MNPKRRWNAVLRSIVLVLELLACAAPILVQTGAQEANNGQHQRAYNPYPPGILPSNLSSEIARVLREVDVIESRALARWHALKSLCENLGLTGRG